MGTDGTYPSSFRPTEFVCVSSRIPVTEKPTHRKVRYVWGTRQNLRGRDLWNPTLTSQESAPLGWGSRLMGAKGKSYLPNCTSADRA
jgi:hypothetical protein